MIHTRVIHLRMIRVIHLRAVPMLRVVRLSVVVMLTMRMLLGTAQRRNRTRRGVRLVPGVLCLDRNGHGQGRDDRYPQDGFVCSHYSTLTSRNTPACTWKATWQSYAQRPSASALTRELRIVLGGISTVCLRRWQLPCS